MLLWKMMLLSRTVNWSIKRHTNKMEMTN
ncbi:hypothetical protein E2I00_001197 [Balaenoptera physalus]|uniref:Uncharacterized protein n=1 Tax=Balaenoptera physalus TaxID=9770 RepID=A0A6A1Q3P3_BALPH|nr:hypothetical protein E2I00_001197 [Balaenoptera physalus]